MVASRRCKSLLESLAQRPREEAQKAIVVLNSTFGEELTTAWITDMISILVVTRRMDTKHKML